MERTRTPAAAQRLTIMFSARDRSDHHSLATEVLARARRAQLAGATLLEGIVGQGRSGERHHHRLFGDDVPLAIVIVDDEARITAFAADLGDMLRDALLVVEDVTVFRA